MASSFSVRGLRENLLALFFPALCQLCRTRRATAPEGYVCSGCFAELHFVVPPFCNCCGTPFDGEISTEFECSNCRDLQMHFRSARSAVLFKGKLKEVIHAYKYREALWFEPFLSDLLFRQALPVVGREHWDWIVPVPLHWRKCWMRSYNQAERIARCLGRVTGIPVNTKMLKRTRATPTQTFLSRKERAENVKGAFSFCGSKPLRGSNIILVDDVLTTGATASACAKVLKCNGAAIVDVWTVARGTLA